MTDQSGTAVDRRYICTRCESVVRARWSETVTFFIGCDCTSVPVVPQMGQAETPDKWRVERPECCQGVEPKTLETVYGGGMADFECSECGAQYKWDGAMVGPPDPDESEPRPEANITTFDGHTAVKGPESFRDG